MILLEAAIDEQLILNEYLDDDLRSLMIEAAFECLSVSAAPFFYDTNNQLAREAFHQLQMNGFRYAIDLLEMEGVKSSFWISTLMRAFVTFTTILDSIKSEDRTNIADFISDIVDTVIKLATVNLNTLTDHQSTINMIASDLDYWINAYKSYGVLHYKVLQSAIVIVHSVQFDSMQGKYRADSLVNEAYELLDTSDDINTRFRDAERFADVLYAAHLTLPIYTAALTMLRSAREQLKEISQERNDDLIKEIGVAEESRVACVETLTESGGNLIGQIGHSFLRARDTGQDVHELLSRGVLDLSSRIPHYPKRLREAWVKLAQETTALGVYPYSYTLSGQINDLILCTMHARFGAIFSDTYVTKVAKDHYRKSGLILSGAFVLLRADRVSGTELNTPLQPLVYDEKERQEEAQAALGFGNSARVGGDISGALTAYKVAYRLGQQEYSPLAAINLAGLYQEKGNLVGAEALLRAVIITQHPEHAPFAAIRLASILNEQDVPGVEQALRWAFDSGHKDHAPCAALNLGVLLYHKGTLQEAEALLRKAVEMQHPDWSAPAADYLGNLKLDQGNLKEAAKIFQIALNFNHSYWSLRSSTNLGFTLYHLGDYQGAEAALRNAITADDEEIASKAKQYLAALLDARSRENGLVIKIKSIIRRFH